MASEIVIITKLCFIYTNSKKRLSANAEDYYILYDFMLKWHSIQKDYSITKRKQVWNIDEKLQRLGPPS